MAESIGPKKSESRGGDVRVDWESLKPKFTGREDEMEPGAVAKNWVNLYRVAVLKMPSEDIQAAFRLAIYKYCCINGCSREGNYAGTIVLSNGHEFEAAVLPNVVGKFAIRRFLRGNMTESYVSMKKSGTVQDDGKFIAQMSELGVAAEDAFATADWLTGCPQFTPREMAAHNAVLNYRLSRSRRARGGVTLEAVEQKRVDDGLHVQGPANADDNSF